MRTPLWLPLAALALVALNACQRGPHATELEALVQQKLDASFQPGTFEVASLSRRGHAAYQTDEAGEHILVYYHAELRFLRDRALASWDKLGVGSLIGVLGATPRGIEGVKAKGNLKGDALTVRGALAFARDGAEWKPVAYRPLGSKRAEPGPTDKRELPYRRHLDRLGEIGQKLVKDRDATDVDWLSARLDGLKQSAERRLGRREGTLGIATAAPTGEYHRLGKELAETLGRHGHKAAAYPSAGSRENCRLLEQGEVDFALVQSDVAAMAYEGDALFSGDVPMRKLRAVGALYPEAVQLVTLRSTGIQTLADLRGKRVSLGRDGSGARVNAMELLRTAGVEASELGAIVELGTDEAIDALAAGRIDALFLTQAYPTPAITALAETSAVTLVCLEEPVVATLISRYRTFVPLELAAHTYPGQARPCTTVGVTATLLTREDTPVAEVRSALDALYGSDAVLAPDAVQSFLIGPKTAQAGLAIPLHPEAEAYFASRAP